MSDTQVHKAGSSKNRRPCPAIQGTISPADCGAKRGSALSCPAHCEFYPFGLAAHTLWAKVNESWNNKAVDYIIKSVGVEDFQAAMRRVSEMIQNPQTRSIVALYHAIRYFLLVRRDSSGRTLADIWEGEGWTGLNNDERVLALHLRRSLPTVVEVQRRLSDSTVLCTDMFEPGAAMFVIRDRGVASWALRFTRAFGWLIHYPHFSRLDAAPYRIGRQLWKEWISEIDRRFEQEAKSRPELTRKRHLAEKEVEAILLLADIQARERNAALSSLDAMSCVALYDLVASPGDIEAVLQSKLDFRRVALRRNVPGQQALASFDWVRLGESAELDKDLEGVLLDQKVDGVGTVASIDLSTQDLALFTYSKKKYDFARMKLDKYLGPMVKLREESCRKLIDYLGKDAAAKSVVDDVQQTFYGRDADARMRHQAPGTQQQGTAPSQAAGGAAWAPESEERSRQRRSWFLDKPNESLGGATPRQAAQDPELRPMLIEVLKTQINSWCQDDAESNLETNLDWMLDELRVPELK